MLWLLVAWALSSSLSQTPAPAGRVDVSTLKVGSPVTVAELDLGKLKGDLSQIGAGVTFSWGPENSGAIAYVNRDGQLMLFDQSRHKQTVAGVKDATLPAWSMDGRQIAWAQKAARRKFTLMSAAVTK